jgi:hypothetical protein
MVQDAHMNVGVKNWGACAAQFVCAASTGAPRDAWEPLASHSPPAAAAAHARMWWLRCSHAAVLTPACLHAILRVAWRDHCLRA